MQRVSITYTTLSTRIPFKGKTLLMTETKKPPDPGGFFFSNYTILRLSVVFVEIRNGLNSFKKVEDTVVFVWTMNSV